MQTIYISHPYGEDQVHPRPIVMALGFFDGVHLGHQKVIKAAVNRARDLGVQAAVMTFDKAPRALYQDLDPQELEYLSPLSRKEELMAQLGVDILYVVEYSWAFSGQSPQAFVDRYVVDFNAVAVTAGFDYTYGKKAVANMQTLPGHSQGRFEVIELSQETIDYQKVGSRFILRDLDQGEIGRVNQALAYTYQTQGRVVQGAQRGRELGYPTANIQDLGQQRQKQPGIGVYVTSVCLKGRWYPSMTSVGYNVTFEQRPEPSVEVYILDFNQSIYGEEIRIRWHQYLRPEIKFSGAEALVQQLKKDEAASRAYFSQEGVSQEMEDLS